MSPKSAQPASQAPLPLDPSAAQRKASNPGASVWVSASAGSGKTKVLADRVTRLLLSGVAPNRILCLTFTRAAAAEMAIRLTQRLSRWATCEDGELEKELFDLLAAPLNADLRKRARRLFAHVLATPGGMRIQTIHAFAQEILRRFPIEAGLSPQFAVMEEREAQALWAEAMADLLQSAAEGKAGAAELQLLVRTLGEESLNALMHEVAATGPRLRLAVAEAGGGQAFAQKMRASLGLESGQDEASFRRDAAAEGAFDRAALKQAALLIAEKGTKKFAELASKILHWLAQEDEEGRLAWFDDYLSAFLTKDGAPRKEVANKAILDEAPQILDTMGREAMRLLSVLERIDTARAAEETEAVLALGLQMLAAYEARKTAQGALDFDDLIARTRALLERPGIAPWVLFKLDGGIDHILVDESQDTNPAQWHIVKALAEEYFAGHGARAEASRTLFVVGDEKQSIYSFLKADPEEFSRMRAFFAAKITESGAAYDEVPMTISFRSAPAILRAVDAVFAPEAVRAGVSHEDVTHQAFRAQGAGRVEVWPLLKRPEEEKKKRATEAEEWVLPVGYQTVSDPAAELARALAAQIKEWTASGVSVYDKDTKTTRPMSPGDVMVLVQTRGRFVEHLVRALKMLGVPVSGVDRMHLISQLPVMDLLALLQFTLLPQDDLTLACLLRGPFIGASEDDLMRLAIGRKGSLWESMRSAGDQDDALAAWRDYLEEMMSLADRMPPLAMLTHILTAPCPADAVSGRRALLARLGPDAEDPVDELLGAAEDYGARHSPSLQAFLHWMSEADVEVKREMEAALGRVRITTVHASKGLEAPVVILPDTVRVPSVTKLPKILWDEAADLAFYIPREPRSARLAQIRGAARTRQLEEYRRLLYVALTRAADRLIVCGFMPERADKFEESWYSLVASALKPLHDEAFAETGGVMTPEIVMADYALPYPGLRRDDEGEGVAPQRRGKIILPAFLFAPPPEEPLPPRPLVPSRAAAEEPPVVSPRDARFARGRLIHRLLQSLPDLAPDAREAATLRFLASPQHDLTAGQQQEIAAEILRLLNDPAFAPLFAPESRAEVPIVGIAGARLIAGQIDRLALVGGEVWIVDYKTNRPPPAAEAGVPAAYRAQMEAYRTVLQGVYTKHTVRCFLLWTYTPALMEILPGT